MINLGAGRNNKIIVVRAKCVFVFSKKLSDVSFNFISINRVYFCFNGNTKSCVLEVIFYAKNDKLRKAKCLTTGEKLFIFPRIPQLMVGSKSKRQLYVYCRYLEETFGVRRFLPLVLRRAKTFWPVFVFILARKPCLLLRFVLLG